MSRFDYFLLRQLLNCVYHRKLIEKLRFNVFLSFFCDYDSNNSSNTKTLKVAADCVFIINRANRAIHVIKQLKAHIEATREHTFELQFRRSHISQNSKITKFHADDVKTISLKLSSISLLIVHLSSLRLKTW